MRDNASTFLSGLHCRFEFEKNSLLKDSEDIQFQVAKAKRFLTNKWLV